MDKSRFLAVFKLYLTGIETLNVGNYADAAKGFKLYLTGIETSLCPFGNRVGYWFKLYLTGIETSYHLRKHPTGC